MNTKTEPNFIHGLALIRLSGTEPGTEEDRRKVVRGGGGGGTKKIFMQAREKQLKLTKKIHAAPVIFSNTPAINSITVRGLAVLGERIEYAAEIQATVSSANLALGFAFQFYKR